MDTTLKHLALPLSTMAQVSGLAGLALVPAWAAGPG
jgi:hypothetical protein